MQGLLGLDARRDGGVPRVRQQLLQVSSLTGQPTDPTSSSKKQRLVGSWQTTPLRGSTNRRASAYRSTPARAVTECGAGPGAYP